MIAKVAIGITDSRRTSGASPTPPVYVQSNIVVPTLAATSHNVTFSGAVVAGNLIIVAVSTFTTAGSGEVANDGVTDNLGNTYTRVANVQGVTSTAMWLSIHVAENINGGSCTITANALGTAAFHTIAVHEYSNAATSSALDIGNAQRNASSISAPSPTIITSNATDLIFAAMTFGGNTTSISIPTIGYSQRQEDENGNTIMPINTADKTVTSVGSQSATWELGATRESLTAIIGVKGTISAPSPPDTTPPGAFTLSSPLQSDSTISLSWTTSIDNVGIAGYDVYVDSVYEDTTTSTIYNVTGLSPSTSYSIFVRARDAAGNTTDSNTINPSTTAASSGDEIFRITSTGDGWDYKDPSSGWTAMTLYGGTGILNATANGITYKGYIFTNTGATNGGHPVQVSGDSVIFEYCIFKTSRNVGIRGNGANNIIVRNCLFFDLGIGVWISFSTNVKVLECQFLNMKYVRAVPAAGSARSGQAVFTEAATGTGNEVSDNRVESNFGEAYNEDHFNTYASEGTSGNPYYLRRNLIRGGSGSHTGGGMIIGDAGSDYIIMDNNRLVNPGWYGFQIYGGNSCVLSNNYLWSDFTLPTQLPWNRVGFLVYDGISHCFNMSVGTSNVSRYRKGQHGLAFDGTIWNLEDGCSYGACCTSAIGGHNITQSTSLTPTNMPMPDGSTGFPSHLINYVSVDDYWKIRSGTFLDSELVNSHTTNQGSGSLGNQNSPNVNSRRPTASVSGGPTINIVTTSTTLTSAASIASGGPGTFTLSAHSWTQTGGPNTATIASPTEPSTIVSGMVTGAYIFRYVVEQNNSIYNLKTYQAYWVTVNVNLA